MIPCPRHLTGLARVTFRAVAAEMQAAGTVGLECRFLVERYSVTFARWREAEAKITELGALTTAPRTGTPAYSLWLAISHQEGDRLGKMERELGLTPVARRRLGAVANRGKAAAVQSSWAKIKLLQGGKDGT